MDKYGIGRIAVLTLLGMFTGYTLVSLFGLIIGTILSLAVLFAYIKVMNRMVDDDDDSNYAHAYDHSNTITRPAKIKIRYRCLVCYNIHNRRECPRCGSMMKLAEF